MKKHCFAFLFLFAFCFLAFDAFADQIVLEKTYIPEGRFYILMSKPKRIVKTVDYLGDQNQVYSYFSIFPNLGISYITTYENIGHLVEKYPSILNDKNILENAIAGIEYVLKSKYGDGFIRDYMKPLKYRNKIVWELRYSFIVNSTMYNAIYNIHLIHNEPYLLGCYFPVKYQKISQYRLFLDSFELK